MKSTNAFLCKIVGHDPHYFQTQYIYHGRWRTGSGCFCTRCGIDNSLEVHTPGPLCYLTDWRFYFRNAVCTITDWCATKCNECGNARTRFGRAVGDHSQCHDWLHIIEKATHHDQ